MRHNSAFPDVAPEVNPQYVLKNRYMADHGKESFVTSITQEFHIKHRLLREHLTFSVTGNTLLECLEKAKQYARESQVI